MIIINYSSMIECLVLKHFLRLLPMILVYLAHKLTLKFARNISSCGNNDPLIMGNIRRLIRFYRRDTDPLIDIYPRAV